MSATSNPSRGMAAPSGGRQGRHLGYLGVQGFERTRRGADLAGGDTQITRRGVQAAMPQQQLNGAQIGTGLQQMNGERMAQGMRRDRFAETRLLKRLPACNLDSARRDRLHRPAAWKQPLFWTGLLP